MWLKFINQAAVCYISVFSSKGKQCNPSAIYIQLCLLVYLRSQLVTCFCLCGFSVDSVLALPWLQATHTRTRVRIMIYTSTDFISLHLSNKNTLFSKKRFSINGNTCALAGTRSSHSAFSQFHKQWLNLEWMWLWSAVRVWGQITQMKVCVCQASCCWPRTGLG